MDTEPGSELTIQEYPTTMWLIGAALDLVGLFLFFRGSLIGGMIALLGGMLLAMLAQVLTVTADRAAGMVRIHRRSPLRSSTQEAPISEVAQVEVERSTDSDSTTYRTVIVLKNGERLPLRPYYSSGNYRKRKEQAEKLSSFLGVKGPNAEPPGLAQMMHGAVHSEMQITLQGQDERGLHWQVERGQIGGMPLLRWSAPSAALPGDFLFLAQKPQGMRISLSGGVLGMVSGFLYRQVLGLYGFSPEHTPGIETAQAVEPLGEGLDEYFGGIASSAELAPRLLNPWVAEALRQWVTRRPLQQGQPADGKQVGQLVVLFSPLGLFAEALVEAGGEDEEDLIRLGLAVAHEARLD
jgi:hypothetical protein